MKTYSCLSAYALTLALGIAVSLQAANGPALDMREASISRETKLATSFAPVAKKAASSVVNIYTTRRLVDRIEPFLDESIFRFFGGSNSGSGLPRERRVRSLGSGVIVSANGYILSNHHVVEDADDIKVVLSDGREFTAKVVGADAQTDVAVLLIDANGLPAIPITDSDKLEVGDAVLAIGNPFGVGQTVTIGHVSGLGRGGMGIIDYEDFIQTDASINPGNSGGALVDAEGRLVGINTAIVTRTGGSQGVGFAVPVNLARSIMDRLVKDGKVTRGYLGVVVQPITESLAREFKLPGTSGALVGEVARRSPAEEAGVKEGDVIVEFNGRKVSDSRHLQLMVAQTAPDTKVALKILRDGKDQTLTVKLDELRTGGMNRTHRFGTRSPGRSAQDLFDGVTVGDLDAHTRREFDIPSDVRGAVVTDVDSNSPAAAAGLRPGDVIQEIDRAPVRDADSAIELTRHHPGRGALLRVWSNGASRYLILGAEGG